MKKKCAIKNRVREVIEMAVRKEKDKSTWMVQASYVDYEGNRKRTTKRGFRTKREALEWENELKKSSSCCLGMTMNSFYERYRADVLPTIRESTWDTKDTIIRLKILPHLGERKLNEITPSDIRAWQSNLKNLTKKNGNPFSETYLRTINAQLNAIFNHAVKFYRLPENPCHRAGIMGKSKGKEKAFWTNEEYSAFIKCVSNKPESYYGFEILYWCGLRIGELLGLTPNDFNFKEKIIYIRKAYTKYGFGPTKTEKGNRDVVMPDTVAEEIEDYIESIFGLESNDRIFTRSASFYRHELERGAKESGVKRLSPHELRHSHITYLVSQGFDPTVIGDRVGHESIRITLQYAHPMEEKQKQMSQLLNAEREAMNE